MNRTMTRRRSGFSLIELLVVIAIIGTLAALLMPAVAMVRARARRVVAQSEVNQILAGWKHYYSEYQRWPDTVVSETAIPLSDDLARLLWAGELDTDNPRRISFIQFNRMNADTNPISPWGDPEGTGTNYLYYVKFDSNFDNLIPAAGDTPPADVRDALIVWTVNWDETPGEQNYIVGSWRP